MKHTERTVDWSPSNSYKWLGDWLKVVFLILRGWRKKQKNNILSYVKLDFSIHKVVLDFLVPLIGTVKNSSTLLL